MPGYGVDVDSCTSATLSGITVDTLTPAFSQAELVAAPRRGRAVVRVEEGFPLPDDPVLFNQTAGAEIKVVFWDRATRRMLRQQMNNPMSTVPNCSAATRVCEIEIPALSAGGNSVARPSAGIRCA